MLVHSFILENESNANSMNVLKKKCARQTVMNLYDLQVQR